MKVSRPLLKSLVTVLTVALAMSAGPGRAEDQRAEVDARFDALVSTTQIAGATLLISDGRGLLYQRSAGSIGEDTPVPIASASKWLTTAAIMSLVEDGQLALDATVGQYLADAPEAFRPITLRQLLSHTSGIEPQTVLQVRVASSSKDVADAILGTPLMGQPGSTFAYGGSSMQLAAYIAEVRTGKSWKELFDDRVARPLGLTSATWVHPLAVSETGPAAGSARARGVSAQGRRGSDVPFVAGGLSMSARDLSTFMQMILGYGQLDGVRVLSEASVREMERLQTGGVADFRRIPVALPTWRYGLGIWCEQVDPAGACAITNSAGAFGTVPWVDRSTGRAGVFVTRTQLPKVLNGVLELRSLSNGVQR
jgi:CubicO group peptidase (beta-lactamase class C family)